MGNEGAGLDFREEECAGMMLRDGDIPLNYSKIDIVTKMISVYEIVDRISRNKIDLHPALQRRPGIWKDTNQSRLIESLLLGIPLQSFYFFVDDSANNKWQIIDGLQRVTTIHRFVVLQELRLKGLEYLREFEGAVFSDLPMAVRDSLLSTQIPAYIVRPGTPQWVRFNIFKRVNTGGMPLNSQEIRNVILNGKGIDFINRIAEDPLFIEATHKKIKHKRMLDSEYVNRFLAFLVLDIEESYRDMESFLNDAVRVLNVMSDQELDMLSGKFFRTMLAAKEIFGKYAFTRYVPRAQKFKSAINKAIFDSMSCAITDLSDFEISKLSKYTDFVVDEYRKLFVSEDEDSYAKSISESTSDRKLVFQRMKLARKFFRDILEDICDN